ncbi:hypothetical protein CSC62_05295 [Pseudoxanthomonas jiangsuensis]|uniref:hypothetical protein n=1 Tax=Pseudoxanthomonas jiangsuensis TaxID=619688 RepID=UPI001391DE36|nr:hypothetical protein [Pseudoxanthomonas jiangsuensis]KAF1698325.1 hypothetical protein CSC62_05295 [Pseudoxanthomonas jiangsuensis]
MPRLYALAPAFTALIVVLFAAFAAGVCFYARADALGVALALVALIFAIDTAHEWRKAAAEARAAERTAPFVRINPPQE